MGFCIERETVLWFQGIMGKSGIFSTAQPTQRLTTTDLSFRNWPDPDESSVKNDDNYAHYPEGFSIVCAVVPEDNGEDDTTQVA
jgi:hypothetical protein